MDNSSPVDFRQFFFSDWSETELWEFRNHDQQLIAVSVCDFVGNALSAVYTFYDTDFLHLSPGRYTVLKQIEIARELEKDYLYLGYWIPECKKMAYKIDFLPAEVFINEDWMFVENRPSLEKLINNESRL